jgi:uncharacterized protein
MVLQKLSHFNMHKYKKPIIIILSIVVLLILAINWIWFIETRMIQVKESTIDTGFKSRFVLISDIHVGWYKNADYVNEIADKINAINNIDFVIIAGDWTTHITPQTDIKALLQPISKVKYPMYATLGNHDFGLPENDNSAKLQQILPELGVTLMEDKTVAVNNIQIAGVYDYYENTEAYKYIEQIDTSKPTIVISHNPDVVVNYSKKVSLTVSGHTHCGQVNIPVLYKKYLPIETSYINGEYSSDKGKLYVSCGLGEVGVPFRLFNRPTIDVLNTY